MSIQSAIEYASVAGSWIEVLVSLTRVLSWPVLLLVLVLLLKSDIKEAIGRIRQITRDGSKFDVILDLAQEMKEPRPPAPNAEQVRQAIESIGRVEMSTFAEYKEQILNALDFYGIDSGKLSPFVKSQHIWDWLSGVYIRELRRPAAKPLDPLAVAVWGGPIFKYGMAPELLDEIVHRLRSSKEYHDLHATKA